MAIVCGFLIVILLCLICFFAHKTRSKIWKYGKQNIYWDKVPVVQEGPNVEEWVSLDAGWGCLGLGSSLPRFARFVLPQCQVPACLLTAAPERGVIAASATLCPALAASLPVTPL